MDQKFLKTLLRADYDSVVSIIKQDKRNKKFFVPVLLRMRRFETVYGDNTLDKSLATRTGRKTNWHPAGRFCF